MMKIRNIITECSYRRSGIYC